MKKVVRNFVIATMLFMSFGIIPNTFGQVPQKFSYQAVIRNSAGVLVTAPVSMKVSILDGTTVVYAETFTGVVVNSNGLATVEIGGGTPVGAFVFTAIDWTTGAFSVKTETDLTNTGNYTAAITGTSNLLSVPFALYSLNGTPGAQGLPGQTGPQGIAGNDGAQGQTGPQGIPGNDGAQGQTGPQGVAGNDGAQGQTGPQGVAGNDGAQGQTGPQGVAGNDGAQGTTGDQGAAGNSAFQVWLGLGNSGDEAQFIASLTGSQGIQGTTGIQGATGDQGIQGIQGVTGEQGVAGVTGDQGIQGIAGLAGPTGAQGVTGPAGLLSVNCLDCHNHATTGAGSAGSTALKAAKYESEFSKHGEGKELALEEGLSAGCAPCHSHEGFHSVVSGNVVATYTASTGAPYSDASPKYSFSYNAADAASKNLTTMPGNVGCFTCHETDPAAAMARLDFSAGVPSTMWATTTATPAVTFNMPANGGESNLCIKCHQPRPMSGGSITANSVASGTNYAVTIGDMVMRGIDSALVVMNIAKYNAAAVNYADLAANPTQLFYDTVKANFGNNTLFPGYRSHNHYGAVGAIMSGSGAVQFGLAADYDGSSTHQTAASCQSCHMVAPKSAVTNAYGTTAVASGGHTFVASKNNLNCKTATCHPTSSFTTTYVEGKMALNKAALSALAARLKTGGVEIMHKNTDATSNIFANLTTAGYDGYLDIYDPSTNPTGLIQNPVMPTYGQSKTSKGWTAAQKATNMALTPMKPLTKAEWGAIINFQLLLREFSNGIHNPAYSSQLITNTNAALTAAGVAL